MKWLTNNYGIYVTSSMTGYQQDVHVSKFGMSSKCIFYTKWHSTAVARNNLFWLPFLHECQSCQLSKFPARSVQFKEVWTTFILIRLRRHPLLLWEQLPNIRWSTWVVYSLVIITHPLRTTPINQFMKLLWSLAMLKALIKFSIYYGLYWNTIKSITTVTFYDMNWNIVASNGSDQVVLKGK